MKRIVSLFGKLTLGVAIMFCLPTMGFAQSRYLDNIKAAERGDADAQCVIGDCYKAGDGVEQSNAYAVKWYRKAAEQGNAEACYRLGMSYYNAEGVFQDFVEARHWLEKTDFSKHNDAALMLASFYRTGTGGPADSVKAEKYKQMIEERFKPKEVIIMDVFPFCGINIGPGLMAAYYIGKPISKGLTTEKALLARLIAEEG